MAAKDDLGRAGEEHAAHYLTTRGYGVVDRNWRCAQGELDIVAEHEDVLCFVEVKTRRSTNFGHPFDAIDERKRQRLWRLAYAWLEAHPERGRHRMLRLEIVGIVGAVPAAGTLDHLVDLR